MASKLSDKYLQKVEQYVFAQGEVALERIAMQTEQRYRARLALEGYHVLLRQPTAEPRKLLMRIAARDYEELLKSAELGNEEAREYVTKMQIRRDPQTGCIVPRTYSELTNDVALLNWLVGRFSTSQGNIHKAIYESNARWLSDFGRKTGSVSAIKEAQRNFEKLNNDFNGNDDPQSQMPNTDINITGDVGVVKEGQESLPDEEKEKYRKQFGLTEKELAVQIEEINGIWQPVEEEEKDIFVENEQ